MKSCMTFSELWGTCPLSVQNKMLINPYFDRALLESDYEWLLSQVQRNRRRPDFAHLQTKTAQTSTRVCVPPNPSFNPNTHDNNECMSKGEFREPFYERGDYGSHTKGSGLSVNFFQPNTSSKERGGIERFGIKSTDDNHLRLHMPISPIAQSNNLLNEENRSSEATIGSEGEGEEWHEPKRMKRYESERVKRNETSEQAKPGEDHFDLLGEDESIPDLVEDKTDEDVEINTVKRDNDLPMPPVKDLRGEGDGDECPIDNFSKASSVSHDPSRERCKCTENESQGSGRKGSADAIGNDREVDDDGGREKNRSAANEIDDDVEKNILIYVCEKEAIKGEDEDTDESLLRCYRNDSDGDSDFSIPAPISETKKNEIEMCCVDEISRKDTDEYDNVIAPYGFKRKGELVSLLSPSSPTNKDNPSVSSVESPRSVVDDDECRLSRNEVSNRSKASNPRHNESSEFTERKRSLGADTKRKENRGANDEELALRDSPSSSKSQVKDSITFTGVRGRSVSCHVERDCNQRVLRSDPPPSDDFDKRFLRSEPPPSDELTSEKTDSQHLSSLTRPVEYQGEDGSDSKEESLTLIPTMNIVCLGAQEKGASTMTHQSQASQGTREQISPMVTPPAHEESRGGASKRGAQSIVPSFQEGDKEALKPGAPTMKQPGQKVKRGAPMMASPSQEQIQGSTTGRACTNGSPQINPAREQPMHQTPGYEPSNEELLIDVLWEHVLNERGLKMKKLVERNEKELVFCRILLNSADFFTRSIQEKSLLMFRDLIKGGIKTERKHQGSPPKERVRLLASQS